MSMMVSFVLSFFPRDVLDEILNLIESVSEDFLTTLPYKYSFWPKLAGNLVAVYSVFNIRVLYYLKMWIHSYI